MTIEITLPNLGDGIDAGDVLNVLVSEGQMVTVNQPIAEIETGKAMVEIPSTHAGKISKIHIKPGSKVPVGGKLISLDGAAGGAAPAKAAPAPAAKAAPAPAPAPKPAAAPPAAKPAPVAAPVAVAPPPRPPAPVAPIAKAAPAPVAAPAPAPAPVAISTGGASGPAGPSTRRLARELGVDLGVVQGSGRSGRIMKEDVIGAVRQANQSASRSDLTQAALDASPATKAPPGQADQDPWGRIRRDRLTKMRATIAERMVYSATTIPHVTNYDDADVTELEQIRSASKDDYAAQNIKLTSMPFLMKAVAMALRRHPLLNSSLDMENQQLIYKEYVNLGVAIDTERGLVVPVVRGVDRMSIPQIAVALQETVEKVKRNAFTLEDLKGGSFTISNLGAIGGTLSTPIINAPEVAILLVGRSRKMPVVVKDEIKARLMMPMSLSYDHRVVDGAVAARFLNEVIGFLQNPGRLLLAP